MADRRVMEIFEELKTLHAAKDADYAGDEPLSNFRKCEAFGIPAWKGCLVRMADKYSRLVSLVGRDGAHEVSGEGVEDTLKDLAVYSIIVLALMGRPLAMAVGHMTSYSGDDALMSQEDAARLRIDDDAKANGMDE